MRGLEAAVVCLAMACTPNGDREINDLPHPMIDPGHNFNGEMATNPPRVEALPVYSREELHRAFVEIEAEKRRLAQTLGADSLIPTAANMGSGYLSAVACEAGTHEYEVYRSAARTARQVVSAASGLHDDEALSFVNRHVETDLGVGVVLCVKSTATAIRKVDKNAL